MVPVTTDQFFGVFTAYNQTIWPAQVALILLALMAVYAAIRAPRGTGRAGAAVLAFLWLWMGVVYHLTFFARVNPAAYAFGVLFLAQALLFGWAALRGSLSLRMGRNAYGVLGAIFIVYALLIYPIIGVLTGHGYPAAPTFGAPCPTTIFTFGVLLWADRRVPVQLLVVPVLWSVAGASAVWVYGVVADAALPLTGLAALTMITWRNHWLGAIHPPKPAHA
jgi:hypothetical protein